MKFVFALTLIVLAVSEQSQADVLRRLQLPVPHQTYGIPDTPQVPSSSYGPPEVGLRSENLPFTDSLPHIESASNFVQTSDTYGPPSNEYLPPKPNVYVQPGLPELPPAPVVPSTYLPPTEEVSTEATLRDQTPSPQYLPPKPEVYVQPGLPSLPERPVVPVEVPNVYLPPSSSPEVLIKEQTPIQAYGVSTTTPLPVPQPNSKEHDEHEEHNGYHYSPPEVVPDLDVYTSEPLTVPPPAVDHGYHYPQPQFVPVIDVPKATIRAPQIPIYLTTSHVHIAPVIPTQNIELSHVVPTVQVHPVLPLTSKPAVVSVTSDEHGYHYNKPSIGFPHPGTVPVENGHDDSVVVEGA